MGFLSEAQKRDIYARAIAVVFPPLDEDYGYVTLEAMLAAKPVITCRDSGGPLEFILPGKTGMITAAKPDDLARAMDAYWSDRLLARRDGGEARRHYDKLGLSWKNVVQALLA
jgi:glycosyltransferase involved in cell wall biosynthesis